MSITSLFPWLSGFEANLAPLYALVGGVVAFVLALATASLIIRLLSRDRDAE